LVESEAPEAEYDRRVFDRPDAAEVIVDWIVGTVSGRERANTPAAEEIGSEHSAHDVRQVFVVDDSGGDALTDVRGQCAYEPLLGVHRQRDVLLIIEPPVPIEPFLERASL